MANVWMVWTWYETGKTFNSPESLSIMGGTGNGGYGQYGFHYMYGLVPFLQRCYNYDAKYADFAPYIALGQGNPALANNTGLHNLFIYYANTYTAEFAYLQNQDFVANYLNPVLAQAAGMANLDNPYIMGTLGSMAVRSGVSGSLTLQAIQAGKQYTNINDQLSAMYSVFQAHFAPQGDDRWFRQLASCVADMQANYGVVDLDTYIPPTPPEPPEPPEPGTVTKKLKAWMMCRVFEGG